MDRIAEKSPETFVSNWSNCLPKVSILLVRSESEIAGCAAAVDGTAAAAGAAAAALWTCVCRPDNALDNALAEGRSVTEP